MGKRHSLRLIVSSDVRVFRSGEKSHATHPAGTYANFEPWARGFKETIVVSRGISDGADFGLLQGPGVSHCPVPNYTSWMGLVGCIPKTFTTVWKLVASDTVAVVRLPEPLSLLTALVALLRRRPVVAVLVANPLSMQGGNSLGWLVRGLLVFLTRFVIARAQGVVYVTRQMLQKDFPAPPNTPSIARSNVRLNGIAARPRDFPVGRAIRLLTVGTNSGFAKGQDVLLESVTLLLNAGFDVELDLVGGGNQTQWLEARIGQLGLEDKIRCHGHVDRSEVESAIAKSDLFCLPSRSEGLPRAMIEALAHGVPGVGSNEGGIPELLPNSQILRERTPECLASVIARIAGSREEYSAASEHALQTVRSIYESTHPELLNEFLDACLVNLGE